MTNIIQYAFTSLWIIAVAVALYGSRNWNSTTALFPHAVGFPILALLVVILAVDIRKGRRRKEKGETEDNRIFNEEPLDDPLFRLAGWVCFSRLGHRHGVFNSDLSIQLYDDTREI